MFRTHKSKLYATAEQEALFGQFASVCRLVYNLALEQRSVWWEQHKRSTGKAVSYVGQAAELTKLRAEFDWIAAVSIEAQQQALQDLDKAYQRFFTGNGAVGYPSFRKRGVSESFRFPGRYCSVRSCLNPRFSEVRLPKIGWCRFRQTRPLPQGYKLREVTISNGAKGWHLSLVIEQPAREIVNRVARPAIGIDRGISNTLAVSDGTFASQPVEALRSIAARVNFHQRRMSRQKLGSNRRAETRKLLSKAAAKAARIRKHWNHVQTSRLVSENGLIVLEALATTNMTRSAKGTVEKPGVNVAQKAGLNRAILNHAWYQFETLLLYKAKSAGCEVVKINPAYTSQTCSECGVISRSSRKSQAVFECISCGHQAHADTNAARNILRAGTRPAQNQQREINAFQGAGDG